MNVIVAPARSCTRCSSRAQKEAGRPVRLDGGDLVSPRAPRPKEPKSVSRDGLVLPVGDGAERQDDDDEGQHRALGAVDWVGDPLPLWGNGICWTVAQGLALFFLLH